MISVISIQEHIAKLYDNINSCLAAKFEDAIKQAIEADPTVREVSVVWFVTNNGLNTAWMKEAMPRFFDVLRRLGYTVEVSVHEPTEDTKEGNPAGDIKLEFKLSW